MKVLSKNRETSRDNTGMMIQMSRTDNPGTCRRGGLKAQSMRQRLSLKITLNRPGPA